MLDGEGSAHTIAQMADCATLGTERPATGPTGVCETRGVVPRALLEATRGLLWMEGPAEARRLVADLVHSLGGELVSAEVFDEARIPLELSFNDGPPMVASARPGTAARALLDTYLPPFVRDVRRVLELGGRVERLARSASVDGLTGLPNRATLDRSLARTMPSEVVIVLDLDHFKAVNDGLGHAAGDEVLAAFGALLAESIRGSDTVGRYGGEEFVVVLPAGGDADAFLSRLQTSWADVRPHPVTFSAGVALSSNDPAEAMKRADAALYEAKRSGRDRWVWAPPAVQTTPARAPADLMEPYLASALSGDRPGGVRLVLDLLDRHMSSDRSVVELLATAQQQIGERWERNEITAVHEHLATGVTTAVLDALAGESSEDVHGLTLVACPEGDWHSLAAEMFATSLRAEGIGTQVIGASAPGEAVAEFLRRSTCDALAVSCTLPAFFPGVVKLVNLVHSLGVPVIVGGRALGANARRAHRLGADAWAPSAVEAAVILDGWRSAPPVPNPEPVLIDPAVRLLFDSADRLAADAMEVLPRWVPARKGGDPVRMARRQEYLAHTVSSLAASALVDDDSVFLDYLAWLARVLAPRGVSVQALVSALDALGPGVGQISGDAVRLLATGRAELVAQVRD
ncbi:diguanylate cyclase domain-containing protein [Phycicoccus duodecadis]|uniref:Diguanylate cyclase (GGDEF)-like protein n=1 Tax=Phycicoccus duodecadis TaxID=173053 RepID=A0A2N3YLN7_9MICO|nr:diguanylate cyclase [Phycicoccus duodecadis]PKW27777.1 diguanylate cyclase (GGDEF)-like protein [Phycicoccus duodecadis]